MWLATVSSPSDRRCRAPPWWRAPSPSVPKQLVGRQECRSTLMSWGLGPHLGFGPMAQNAQTQFVGKTRGAVAPVRVEDKDSIAVVDP